MTDTNGRVAAAHLGSFAGYPVSLVMLPSLRAASIQFHQEGYTFALVRGFPAYRDYDTQGAMRRAFDAREFGVAPYYLSGLPGTRPDRSGHGRHGFGLAVDVTSNAPLARRDAILAAHGFHLWTTADRNHYEFGNALVAPPDSAFAGLHESTLTDLESEHGMKITPITNPEGTPAFKTDGPTAWYAVGTYGRVVVPEGHRESLQGVEKYLENPLPLDAADHIINAGGADIDNWLDYSRRVNTPPASAGGSAFDPTALEAAIAAVAKELTALDTQADTYQADLKATLAKGLTISGTAAPSK